MIVACGPGRPGGWEWELAVSRFQPDSQGSVPAATRTLARLMSPALCSMPGWVKVAGAAPCCRGGGGRCRAHGEGGGETARGPQQTAAAQLGVREVLVGGSAAHAVRSPIRGGIASGGDAHLVEPVVAQGQRVAGADHEAHVVGGVAEAGDLPSARGVQVAPSSVETAAAKAVPVRFSRSRQGQWRRLRGAGEGGRAGHGRAQHELRGACRR